MMRACETIIRDMRERRGLTQAAVADILSTSQQQYSRYETGDSELPIRALAMLADYYGVSADYLLGRTQSTMGIAALGEQVTSDMSVGAFLSRVLSLDEEGRRTIVECTDLCLIRQRHRAHRER